MASEALIVLCTCPDEAAGTLAHALVSERLAACVNRLPQVSSVYRWQDAVEEAQEALLLIKTASAVYPRLEARIRQLHPYELPEVVAVRIDKGLPDYLRWVLEGSGG